MKSMTPARWILAASALGAFSPVLAEVECSALVSVRALLSSVEPLSSAENEVMRVLVINSGHAPLEVMVSGVASNDGAHFLASSSYWFEYQRKLYRDNWEDYAVEKSDSRGHQVELVSVTVKPGSSGAFLASMADLRAASTFEAGLLYRFVLVDKNQCMFASPNFTLPPPSEAG